MDTFVDWKTTLVASHSSYVEQLQEAIKNQSEGVSCFSIVVILSHSDLLTML
jgi:hypothetical protein